MQSYFYYTEVRCFHITAMPKDFIPLIPQWFVRNYIVYSGYLLTSNVVEHHIVFLFFYLFFAFSPKKLNKINISTITNAFFIFIFFKFYLSMWNISHTTPCELNLAIETIIYSSKVINIWCDAARIIIIAIFIENESTPFDQSESRIQ